MQTHVSFYVEDEGIGIEEDYHEKVFKIFQQLSRKPGGVGIGLAHCKKIALMHEGETFGLTTPIQRLQILAHF